MNKFKKNILTSCLIGSIALTGCANEAHMGTSMYFPTSDDANVEYYYRLNINGNEYYFKCDELLKKIKEYDKCVYMKVLVDENGDAQVIVCEDENSDYDMICSKSKSYESNKVFLYYGPSKQELEKESAESGYRILKNGEFYDLSKKELIDKANNENIGYWDEYGREILFDRVEFVHDQDGGPDTIIKKKLFR